MTEPDGSGPTATSDALAGTEWVIVRLADAARARRRTSRWSLAFGHDGRMSGSTGVNQLTASYSLTADYLTFGPLATTRRAGTPEQMEQEHRVVAVPRGHVPVRAHDPHPTIDGPLGRVELVTTDAAARSRPTSRSRAADRRERSERRRGRRS